MDPLAFVLGLIIVAAIVFILSVAVASFTPHRHVLRIVAAKELTQEGILGAMSGGQPYTHVLYRCKCGVYHSDTIAGPFALDINEHIENERKNAVP